MNAPNWLFFMLPHQHIFGSINDLLEYLSRVDSGEDAKHYKRWFFFAVFLIYFGISALGLYDFWLWEYDYGHNLSPKAPIKIEGQDYQPPLFGSQYLLNFKADSYPTLGGVAFTFGVILHLVAAFFKRK